MREEEQQQKSMIDNGFIETRYNTWDSSLVYFIQASSTDIR